MADLDKRLDARVKEYAGRWRDALPEGPAIDRSRLGQDPGIRSRWWLVAAAVAAVLAVIVGAQALTQRPTRVDHSVSPSGPQHVVPWKPSAPTSPQIPTHVSPAQPDPALAQAAPACRGSDLRAGRGSLDGAGGTVLDSVDLFARSGVSCRLDGYPTIEALEHGQHVDIPFLQSRASDTYQDPVLVAPHRPAVLTVTWADWCAAEVATDNLRAVLPDGGSLTWRGFGHSPSCQSDISGRRGPMRVEPFAPQRRRSAQVMSFYDDIRASADMTRTVTQGGLVRFTVTLTSPRRLVLDPCPDFTLAAYWGNGAESTTNALNCAAIPYRDGHGHGVLPAGVPVRFAMQLAARTTGEAKFIWNLHTHRDMAVAADGRLTVVGGHGS